MMFRASVTFLLICRMTAEAVAEAPTVDTKIGKIVGTIKEVNVFGKQMKVDRFHGIPYAEPPTGELRFQKPIAKKALTSDGSTFQSTKHGNVCYQLNMGFLGDFKYSEDCLFLNVYAPSDRKEPLAVMIWIYGGGLASGASDHYIADTLTLYGNVIVVTINYRLSFWGFLSTGDKHAPGNLGLWDQHLAFKWVHDYIDAFGGDPNRVTIFGQSAGGLSVTTQSLYSGNAGLFQRVIAQSGSLWVASIKDPKKDAQKLGKLVGCEQMESGPLVRCLQEVPAELLDKTLNDYANGLLAPTFPFLPIVDGEMFTENPRDVLLSENKGRAVFSGLDFMAGICADEGALMLGPFTGVNDPEKFAPDRTTFKGAIPAAISSSYNTEEPVPDIVQELVAHEYTDWSDPDNMEKMRSKTSQMLADILFSTPILRAITQHSSVKEKSKGTYMYSFDVVPPSSLMPMPSWFKNSTHGDELMYQFFEEDGTILKIVPGHEEQKLEDWERDVAKYFMDLLTNFAKTGNPNKPRPIKSEWPAFTNTKQQYFRILRNQTENPVRTNHLQREANLWNKIIPDLIAAIEKSPGKSSQQDTGYCEKDGGCEPRP